MTLGAGAEDASSSLVAFVVAGMVFVGSVAAVLYTSGNIDSAGLDDGPAAASLHSEAGSIADLLLESPGLTAAVGCAGPGTACDWDASATAADRLLRLGLLDPANPGFLDFAKVQNLRLAALAASPTDGKVNYAEAVDVMGLSATGRDFHIRSYPNLQSVRDVLSCNPPAACRDPNLKVAYIGNVEVVRGQGGTHSATLDAVEGITLGAILCEKDTVSKTYRMSITFTHQSASGGEVQFEGVFDTEFLDGGEQATRKTNTFANPSGHQGYVFADYAASAGRSCNAKVTFSLYDTAGSRLARWKDQAPTPVGTGTPGATDDGIILDTVGESFRPNAPITLSYAGEGLETSGSLGARDKLALRICSSTDASCSSPLPVVSLPASAWDARPSGTISIPAGLPVGRYIARLYAYPSGQSPADGVFADEKVAVTSTVPVAYAAEAVPERYVAGSAVPAEVAFLEELVDRFCPSYYDQGSNAAGATPLPAAQWGVDDDGSPDAWEARCAFKGASLPGNQRGDVFPQFRSTLKQDLRERLLAQTGPNAYAGRYDVTNVLVVGSNVDHQVLTSNQVKETIATWVEGGGTLIVFGSADQRLEWLQSVFHVATSETSSNGIAVPDSSHPLLHTADDLDYTEYDHHGQAWAFKQEGANAAVAGFFTNVVVGDNGNPVMAISDPGAFGYGSVILTTWQAFDLYGNGATPRAEGLAFVNNMLMQGYRDLFLDYGPVIPESDHDVIPAVRKAQVCHPEFDDPATVGCEDPIPLDVLVYVF